jgi:hypothetical protein
MYIQESYVEIGKIGTLLYVHITKANTEKVYRNEHIT